MNAKPSIAFIMGAAVALGGSALYWAANEPQTTRVKGYVQAAEQPPQAAPAEPARSAEATATERRQTTCPIRGGEIVADAYVDYQGKRIYFCCAGCDKTFMAKPGEYIREMEAAGILLAQAPASTVNACPYEGSVGSSAVAGADKHANCDMTHTGGSGTSGGCCATD